MLGFFQAQRPGPLRHRRLVDQALCAVQARRNSNPAGSGLLNLRFCMLSARLLGTAVSACENDRRPTRWQWLGMPDTVVLGPISERGLMSASVDSSH